MCLVRTRLELSNVVRRTVWNGNLQRMADACDKTQTTVSEYIDKLRQTAAIRTRIFEVFRAQCKCTAHKLVVHLRQTMTITAAFPSWIHVERGRRLPCPSQDRSAASPTRWTRRCPAAKHMTCTDEGRGATTVSLANTPLTL